MFTSTSNYQLFFFFFLVYPDTRDCIASKMDSPDTCLPHSSWLNKSSSRGFLGWCSDTPAGWSHKVPCSHLPKEMRSERLPMCHQSKRGNCLVPVEGLLVKGLWDRSGRAHKSYLGLSFLFCSFFLNALEKSGHHHKELRNGSMPKLGRSGATWANTAWGRLTWGR